MTKKRIFLSDVDYEKLSRLIESLNNTHRLTSRHLIQLSEELNNVLVFNQDIIPEKYITLNSRVRYINLKTDKEYDAIIVFPVDVDESRNKYSIISPIGTALIGEEENSTATCYAPGGEFLIKIIKVEKPENRRNETIAHKATV